LRDLHGALAIVTSFRATAVMTALCGFPALRRGSAKDLSHADVDFWGRKEPLPAKPFMAASGGGWIVKGMLRKDRFEV
jgi:hypothetical protein